jgi:molybdopterin-guanine dinucleotide biosynthesis protein A
MGRDKALVEIDGVAMADRVIAAAREAGIDDVVVYGGDVDKLGTLTAPVVTDAFPGEGPVGGVLGALEHFRGTATHVLVLACDLAHLDAPTIRVLIDEATGDAHSAVWVAATERLEPLCALWAMSSIDEINAAFSSGQRAVHRVIGGLPHVAVTVSDDSLRNINTADDIAR